MVRKDAPYQGSLKNIPLYNEDLEEYHRQMITASAPVSSTAAVADVRSKKSFVAKLSEEFDLKLLQDGAFALFVVSNFLTSLGFNVPYNFAGALAADAEVIEKHRHWVIMSIGVANCFGRLIIGYLADRSWVRENKETQ